MELEKSNRSKIAFVLRQGLFEFKVLLFGSCNATATFERLMEIFWQV